MLWVGVVLKGEPSPQSEVMCTLEQFFVKDQYKGKYLRCLVTFILPSVLTILPVPAIEKGLIA